MSYFQFDPEDDSSLSSEATISISTSQAVVIVANGAGRKRPRQLAQQQQQQQQQRGFAAKNSVIELLSSDDDDDDDVDDDGDDGEVIVLGGPLASGQRNPPPIAAANPKPLSPVLRVLEIFPDADVSYVQKKLLEQANNIEVVVATMSENGNYPKKKRESDKPSAANGRHAVVRTKKSSEPLHDYSSPAAVFERTPCYDEEVFTLLLYDFSFLKHKTVRALLKQHDGRYTLTRNHIHDTIVGKSPNPPPVAARAGSEVAEKEEVEHYQLLRASMVRGSLPKPARQRFGHSCCLVTSRKKIGVSPPNLTDPILMDEHSFYEKRFSEWLDRVRDKMRGEAANKLALENGSAVTCGCCFSDVAVSECIQCSEKGHLFCKECMVQYVETQVFGCGNLGIDKITKQPALEIKCCDASACNSGFRDELLKTILPAKTWEKYSEMQAKAQIQLAGLGDNLAMCPKCGYQAVVPETQNNFECPVEGCHFVSCRKCGKASHIPLRCAEVAIQNRRDEGRLKIEEALSEAKMRTCPQCKKKFIKTEGCNKMSCPCGMKICYVCRMPLGKGNPYKHFCQTPFCDHKSCGKCKLYSDDKEDDAQAMREAGIAAKEEYEAKLEAEGGAQNLDLDVDEIMQKPGGPKKQKARAARPLNNFRHGQNPAAPRNNPLALNNPYLVGNPAGIDFQEL